MNFLYFDITCKVTIGNVVIDYVNSLTVSSSIKLLEDKATVVLPREYKEAVLNGQKASFAGRNILDFISVDDPVTIEIGYNNDLATEFQGYVKKISADIPLTIECEDEMWLLRKSNFTKAYASLSLQQLVNIVAPGYQYDLIGKVNLGKFTMNNESAFQILTRLRKEYGLHSRFIDKTLQIGFPVDLTPATVHKINLNRNVRAIQNDLKFVKKEDLKILLKGISIQRDGTRIQTTFGEKNGAQRTLHFTGKTLTELKALTEKNYKSLNFDGFQGSIPTWGLPRTKAGDSIQLVDPNYVNSERDGKYLIEGVDIKVNSNDGFKRINKLSLKL